MVGDGNYRTLSLLYIAKKNYLCAGYSGRQDIAMACFRENNIRSITWG